MPTYLEPPAGVGLELFLEILNAELAILVLRDLHHVRLALPPRQDIRMVLKRTNEHDRLAAKKTREARERA